MVINKTNIFTILLIHLLLLLSSNLFAKSDKKAKLNLDSLESFQYQAESKRNDAINLLLDIIKKHPKNEDKAELLLRLAELYWEKSRFLYFAAVASYDKAYEEYLKKKKGKEPILDDRESKEARKKAIDTYGEILENYGNYQKRDFVLFHLALNLSELGMKAASFTLYQQLIADYPKSPYLPNVFLATGEYYFEKRRIDEAISQYSKVLEYQEPQLYGYALYKLAWCYYNQNNFDKAISTFKQVISFCEKQTDLSSENKLSLIEEALNDIVTVYADKGAISEAKEYFARVGGGGYYTKLLIKLGDTFKKNGENKNAIETYEKFLDENELHPQSPFVYISMLDIYRKGEPFSFVSKKLKIYVEKFRPNSPWWNQNSRNDELISNVKTVTESLLRSLGAEYHKKADKTGNKELFSLSSSIYRDYLTLYPKEAEYYDIKFFLAEIEFELARFEEAAKLYAEIVADEKMDKFREKSAYAIIMCYKRLVYGEMDEGVLDKIKKSRIESPLPIEPFEDGLLKASENYLKIAKNEEERVRVAYLAGRILFKNNYFEQAIELFDDIITKNPQNSLAILSANYILEIFNLGMEWPKLFEWSNRFYNSPLAKNKKFKNKMVEISLSAEFKMILSKTNEKKAEEIANEFVNFEQNHSLCPLGDEALYNAILNYKKVNDFESVIKYSTMLFTKYPKSSLSCDVIFVLTSYYERIGDFEKAADEYERFILLCPSHRDVHGISEKLFLLRKGLLDYKRAFATIEKRLSLSKSKGKKLEILEKRADYYFELGSFDRAISSYNEIIKESLPGSRYAIQSKFKMGLSFLRKGKTNDGLKFIDAALKQYESIENKEIIGQDIILQAKFEAARVVFDRFDSVRLKLPINKFKINLTKKLNLLNELKERYIEIIEGGDVTLAIASLYMIGRTYQIMSDALFNAPVPSEYSPDEKKAYKSALEEQAFPIEDKAVEAYESALKKAAEFGNYNEWVKKGLKELIRYKPSSYINVRSSLDKPFVRCTHDSSTSQNQKESGERRIIHSRISEGKIKEAVELMRDLLKKEQSEENYILLAHLYTVEKKYEMPEIIFVLKNKWEKSEIFLEMANAAILSGAYERGILRLKEMLKIDPSNLYAAVNLGVVFFYFGNYDSALASLEKIEQNFLNIRELYFMSVASRSKKDYNSAIKRLEEIISRDPLNKVALFDLGLINYENLSKFQIAEGYFKKYLQNSELTIYEKKSADDFLKKIEIKRKEK